MPFARRTRAAVKPTASFNRLLDQMEHGGKAAAKAVYRRPAIEAARLWRRMLPGTGFVGIAGSAGKTTTKELLYCALKSRYRCTRNTDSNNQLYSIARTLIATGPMNQYCVQEVGASERGAFDPMMALLRPQVGVITNIGTDQVVSHRWPERLSLCIHHGNDSVLANTRLLEAHQAGSVLAAVATACALGVPLGEAALAVSRHEPLLGRMSVQPSARGVTFIRDDWKAPLWSLPAVWQFMGDAIAPRKLIVLGTISDYGGDSRRVYRHSVSQALAVADHVLLAGPRARSLQAHFAATAGERLHGFEHIRGAAQRLDGYVRAGDLVLLKGSNQSDHLARLALADEQKVSCRRARTRPAVA